MAPADGGGVDLVCTACLSTFEHSGRGRRPGKCPACRTSRAPRSSPREDTAPQRPRGIDSLQKNLHGQLTMLGAGVLFIDAFDGTHIMKKAEKGSQVLANLAATNPSIRKGLEHGVELAGWGPVLLWGVEMAVPILAHHGMIRGVGDPAAARRVQPAADVSGMVDPSVQI